VEAIGLESKVMRIVNSVTVLDLVWTGPHLLADLVAFKGAQDYGVYQIYGTHGINGPDNLLYVGMAQDRSFSVRAPEGKEWIPWEAERVSFYLGRLAALDGAPDPSDDEWGRLIRVAEATLIYYCAPPYNSSGVKDSPVMRNLLPNSLVINHKCRHHLPLIVSNIEHAVSGNLRAFGEIVVANDEHA
jgi:hypothetical protein